MLYLSIVQPFSMTIVVLCFSLRISCLTNGLSISTWIIISYVNLCPPESSTLAAYRPSFKWRISLRRVFQNPSLSFSGIGFASVVLPKRVQSLHYSIFDRYLHLANAYGARDLGTVSKIGLRKTIRKSSENSRKIFGNPLVNETVGKQSSKIQKEVTGKDNSNNTNTNGKNTNNNPVTVDPKTETTTTTTGEEALTVPTTTTATIATTSTTSTTPDTDSGEDEVEDNRERPAKKHKSISLLAPQLEEEE
ncbi:hypothetical protein OSB04_015961 [Centaurea solstitialis]|uniref:Uncharacterized protein n=1 Tax=Centaurea solstitialis TaxID=347529 RepID=A0AA38WKL5_9ASTR|nr:hypothetical protein OSB04_015961 [Centaurea solstitialis]